MSRKNLLVFTGVLLLLIPVAPAMAGGGKLDPSFNGKGWNRFNARIEGNDVAGDAVVLADGSVIVGGETEVIPGKMGLLLLKILPDGTRDVSFGTGGAVSRPPAGRLTVQRVRVTAEGKILLLAKLTQYGEITTTSTKLLRFNADGSLDSGFANAGTFIFKQGIYSDAHDMIVCSDGSAILVGFLTGETHVGVTFLLKLRTDGTRDPAFGTNGLLTTPAADCGDGSIIPLSAGAFMVSGSGPGPGPSQVLFRFLADGSLDGSFGSGGRLTLPDWGENVGTAVLTLGPAGTLLVASRYNQIMQGVVVARLLANGSLDTSFAGGTGFYVHPIILDPVNEGVDRLWLQGDGKILVGGGAEWYYPFLFRVNADGTSDTAFNGEFNSRQLYFGLAGLFQSGSRVLAVSSLGDICISAFTAEGEPDTTFGPDGMLYYNVGTGNGNQAFATSALMPDGKIVALGGTENPRDRTYDVLAVRYLPDGTIDRSFGKSGVFTLDLGGEEGAGSVTPLDGGKLFLTGGTSDGFFFARLNPEGTLDTSYGTNGVTLFHLRPDYFAGPTVLPDGKILAVGFQYLPTPDQDHDRGLLMRLLPDGKPDPSFGGGDGKVLFRAVPQGWTRITDMKLEKSGKIVVVGFTRILTDPWMYGFAARFRPDGSFDRSFGTNGIALYAKSNSLPRLWAMALAPDNSIIAVGDIYDRGDQADKALVVRFTAAGAPDKGFASGGDFTWGGGITREPGAFSILLRPDGRALVGGSISKRLDYHDLQDSFLLQLTPGGKPDANFGDGGIKVYDWGKAEGLYPNFLQGNKVVCTGSVFSELTRDDGFITRINLGP